MGHNVPQLPPSSVPIIGQPCSIVALAGPQVTVVCNCEAKTVLLLNGLGVVAQCPGCKRGRMIKAVNADVTKGLSLEVADVPVEAK